MTSPENELRARVIASLADGSPVDWKAIESAGVLPASEIEALKLVESLRAAASQRGRREDEPSSSPALETGFELLWELGRGATSQVWLARDESLKREVALKVLRSDLHVPDFARARFIQEARTLASIEHPNVVRIHAIAESGSDLCLSLELIRGETYERRVRERGPLSAEQAARVGIDLASALAAMHARGLVHRDLKPGNVMREASGRTVLLDFGLARSPDAVALVQSGPFAGTPLFMAPEQFEGREPFGPATDVYGLGALLYWLVAARHPCSGSTFEELRERTTAGKLTALRDVRPDVPPGFASIVERALRREPASRFAAAAEMERELSAFLASRGARRGVQAWTVGLGVGALLCAAAAAWFARRDASGDASVVHVDHLAPSRSLSPDDRNGNGVADSADFAAGSSFDRNRNGIPDECEASACLLDDLAPPSLAEYDRLGFAMSISETHVLVGAHVDDGAGGPDQGSVSVFRRAGIEWMLEHELGADDGQAADYFGVSVALQGNRAVVGAQGDDDRGPDAGAAYLFEREPGSGRWSQIAKFHGSDTNAGDRFGRSCAWVGSRLFVGANGADTPVGLNRGKVYVFDWSGAAFVETAQLHAPDGLVDDQFGVALDSSGDHVAISAFVADVQVGVDAGAVYVFHGNGSSWLLENKLTAALGDTEDRFGSGLSIDGDLLVVGASHDEQAGNLSGTAHVFSHDEATHTWSHATRLRPSDTNDWDSFGWAVKLEGSLLFVGAPFRDTEVSIGAGVVHVFRAQAGPVGRNWVEAARLQAPDATHNQKFGMSLAYRDGLLVVGAPGHDSPGVVDTGRAYAFGVLGSDCNLNVSCDLCDVQAGAPDENGNGVPDGCER